MNAPVSIRDLPKAELDRRWNEAIAARLPELWRRQLAEKERLK